jgi:serine/threonine protein kinase
VKPGNILVTADDVAKIGDFGIARTTGDPELTRAGLVTGTPAYFSPEVARGETPTPAADVWALGATLYVAVEGRPLYPEQANPIALLGVVASTPPPRPQHAGFLTEPIIRMLDPDPRSRWSMTDVAHVLHRLRERHAAADTQAVTAAAGLPRTRWSGPAAAPPPPPLASSPAVPAVPAEPAEAAQLAEPAEQRPEAARREPVVRPEPAWTTPRSRDRGGRLMLLGVVALLVLAAVGGFLLLHDTGSPAGASRQAGHRTASSPRTAKSSPSARLSATPPSSPGSNPSTTPSTSLSAVPPSAGAPISASSGPQFVTSYYSDLPRDTADAWASLTPQYQQQVGGYNQYQGFWATIRSVTASSARTAGKDAVDVDLTYQRNDGGTASEVRRIYLQRSGNGYLISGDKVIG